MLLIRPQRPLHRGIHRTHARVRHGGRRLLVLCLAALALAGCLSRILPIVFATEHKVLLVAPEEGGALLLLPDDDPAYAVFEAEVMAQTFPGVLITIFENTSAAFLATNRMTPLMQTHSNRPVVVLDSDRVGALTQITALHGQEEATIELAIGLGPGTAADPALARTRLASGAAPALLYLAGLRPSAAIEQADWLPADAPTSAELAFWEGWTIALQAEHARQRPEIVAAARLDSDSTAQRDLVRRYERTSANGFRGQDLSAEEAWRTPGVVGTFLYRLLLTDGSYYPQQHMLWMANYDSEQIPYAKVLLAINRMPDKRNATARAFVAAYVETYPAEREAVLALTREVFGE